MKRSVLALLVVLLFPVVASATVAITTNTDIDASNEQISSSSSISSCQKLTFKSIPRDNGAVYISNLSTPSLSGFPLSATSPSFTLEAKIDPNGRQTRANLDGTAFYAIGSSANNRVSIICEY